jgi:hypothetical protein
MEIHVLKLVVGEKEINQMAAQAPLNGAPVRDLMVRITHEGVHVHGKYQHWVSMAFETLWQVAVREGKIVATLGDVKVAGMPVAMLKGIKGILMETICATLDADDAAEAAGDTLHIDLDRLLAQRGFPARTNLTSVRCETGRITIESGLRESS